MNDISAISALGTNFDVFNCTAIALLDLPRITKYPVSSPTRINGVIASITPNGISTTTRFNRIVTRIAAYRYFSTGTRNIDVIVTNTAFDIKIQIGGAIKNDSIVTSASPDNHFVDAAISLGTTKR